MLRKWFISVSVNFSTFDDLWAKLKNPLSLLPWIRARTADGASGRSVLPAKYTGGVSMTARSKFTQMVASLLNTMIASGAVPVIDYALRSRGEQQRLWAKGRQQQEDGSWVIVDSSEVVTKVDGVLIQSKHQLGTAIDIYFVVNNQIDFAYESKEAKENADIFHAAWVALGGRSVIVFSDGSKDLPHFEA